MPRKVYGKFKNELKRNKFIQRELTTWNTHGTAFTEEKKKKNETSMEKSWPFSMNCDGILKFLEHFLYDKKSIWKI